MSENQEAKAPRPDTDDLVEAQWQVAVIPNENVSIHYTVKPRNEEDAITSVTGAFVLAKNGVVFNNYAGATAQELMSPRSGQGMTGDVGVDSSVFKDREEGLQPTAILSGTVRHGEEVANFFFKREFDPES